MELTLHERNQLVENYLPLAEKLAWTKIKQLPKSVDFEEIKSAAYFGLVDASRKFNPSLNFAFATYARIRIYGEIQDYLRSLAWNRNNIKIASLDLKDNDGNYYSEYLESKEKLFDILVQKKYIEEMLETLIPIVRIVVRLYYIEGKLLKEIGDELGFSVGRVSQILKEARIILKEKFNKLEKAA